MISLVFVLGKPGGPTVELGTSRDVAVPLPATVLWLESRLWADRSRVEGRRWFRVIDHGYGFTDNGSRQGGHFLPAPKVVYLEEIDVDEVDGP